MRTDDDINPNFIFQQTDTELLIGILQGTLDPYALAATQMANRGMNHKGEWVGFQAARRIEIEYKSPGSKS